MSKRCYLDPDDVITIHSRQSEKSGSSPGVRDAGLIEFSQQRPQTGYCRDLIKEAAVLWESLAMNHGFVDGNKRIGCPGIFVFLKVNRPELSVAPEPVTKFISHHLEAGTFTKDNLDAWLRLNTKPV